MQHRGTPSQVTFPFGRAAIGRAVLEVIDSIVASAATMLNGRFSGIIQTSCRGITVLRKKTITLEAQDDFTGRTMRYGPALLRSARPGQR